MKIRSYKPSDYFQVVQLMNKTDVEPPAEESDLGGLSLVAEEEHRVIGHVWALVGNSTQAYVDFFAVDPDYQGSHVGWNLLKAMDTLLFNVGVKRYTFMLEKHNNHFGGLVEKYKKEYRVTRLRDLNFYRRELI